MGHAYLAAEPEFPLTCFTEILRLDKFYFLFLEEQFPLSRLSMPLIALVETVKALFPGLLGRYAFNSSFQVFLGMFQKW